MVSPSGEQLEIEAGDYRAVVTESGGALRLLEHRGRPLLDGFAVDRMSGGGRGQLLVPWPNRVRDGAYEFAGRSLQLGQTDPRTGNASHGLVRWAAWTPGRRTAGSVELRYRLMAQSGYPWSLDLTVRYELSEAGLRVTQSGTNLAGEPAPYASGAHPYLTVGDGPVDDLELRLPARTRCLLDDRLLPVGVEPVAGSPLDFTGARRIGATAFNDAFGDLVRDESGVATARLRDSATGSGVELWVDGAHRWLQVYSADDVPGGRRSLAIEPMTAPPDAFNSGQDLQVLAPAGQDGCSASASWGVRALG